MYDLARAITDDRLRTAERQRQARQARQLQRELRTAARTRAADRLEPLLDEAGTLPIGDVHGWRRLGARAAIVTTRLAAEGELPRHLVVSDEDGPVLVNRTIAAAWRRVTRRA